MVFRFSQFSYLAKDGLSVRELSDFHYRVAERFDVMPNRKNGRWAWHDIVTQERGRIHVDEMRKFIPKYIQEHQVARTNSSNQIQSEKGMWFCPIEGCDFKTEDDGSAQAAREHMKHLEGHS